MVNLHRSRIVKTLRLLWIVAIIWFEYGTFWFAVYRCRWPDSKFQTSSPSARPTHLLIIADPQILDHRSYPCRLGILTYISRVLVDLNLRKSWRAAMRLRPDAVVFLGDMMDGGRFPMPDTEYESYYKRFKAIFSLDRNVSEYFIPGNHDTGLKMSASESKQARERYVSHFGPLNQYVTMADHTLIMLDATNLAEEEYNRQQRRVSFAEWRRSPEGTIEFVERLVGAIQPPIILLSHIPLYRPAGSDCGPLREHGAIRQGYGIGYQNILGQDATNFLLQKFRPSLILSGDDHDYCEFNHAIGRSDVAREVTVKSLSMAMNVRRPGFQLLSLLPKQFWGGHITHADELCLLPDQLFIYLSIYLPLLFTSLLVVFLLNATSVRKRSIFNGPEMASLSCSERNAMSSLQSTTSRGSNDDHVDDEYYARRSPSLHLPTPVATPKYKLVPRQSWTSYLIGGRRRISIAGRFKSLVKVIVTILLSFSDTRGMRRGGIMQGFVRDVWFIAAPPLSTIILISLWTMYL